MNFSGKRVLVLGDSHTDTYPLARNLEAALRSEGATVVRYGIGGSAARGWLKGEPFPGKRISLETVRASGPYDVAVIVLGTNDAANTVRASMEGGAALAQGMRTAAGQIKQVADSVGASSVFWAGPPTMKGTTPYYTNEGVGALWDAASPLFGRYAIDGRFVTEEHAPRGDGVHLNTAGYTAWADHIVDYLHRSYAGIGFVSAPSLIAGSLSVILLALAWRFRDRFRRR